MSVMDMDKTKLLTCCFLLLMFKLCFSLATAVVDVDVTIYFNLNVCIHNICAAQ